MREQAGSTLFSPPIERKKATLKISGRDESNDGRRRLNGGYLNYFGGKSIANMPGGRLKGGSSIHHSKDHDRESGGLHEAVLEKTKEDVGGVVETEEGQKRRGPEYDVLLQWGQRKRSRCSRLEPKHNTMEESAMVMNKAIRAERGSEKQQLGGATETNGFGKPARPCTPSVREAAVVLRRNGQISSTSFNGVPSSNTTCSSAAPADAAHFTAADKADLDFSSPASPEKLDYGFACRQSTPDEGSPDAFASTITTAVQQQPNGAVAATLPPTVKRVDLDSFAWPRILIQLSRKEKEEDFLILKGTKLPQRPKKRSKVVEKAIHFCTPGNWLNDLTRGRYDVREKKSVKKKPRGLKAMESMDTDSE